MNGHCLCSAVVIESPNAKEIGACHCGFCRRWGGGPLLAVHCGPNVKFVGADHITTYSSSDWAERAFYACAASDLDDKFLATGEYFVPAGLFDSTDFKIKSQIYIDKKPEYYSLWQLQLC